MNKVLANKISALAEAINKDAENGKVTFSARSHLVDNVLAALASCQEIAFAAFAAHLGLELEQVKVNVKGNLDLRGFLALDNSVFPGFQNIEYETTISSNEPEEKIKDLIEIVQKHCPVLDTLVRPVSVTGKVEIKRATVAA